MRDRTRSLTMRGRALGGTGAAAWTPASLPSARFGGSFAAMRAAGRLWQDAAKTAPAVAASDPVRVWTDPISGTDFTAPSDAARAVLGTDGAGKWWLVFDGSDDAYVGTVTAPNWVAFTAGFAARTETPLARQTLLVGSANVTGYPMFEIGNVNGSPTASFGTVNPGSNASARSPLNSVPGGAFAALVNSQPDGTTLSTIRINGTGVANSSTFPTAYLSASTTVRFGSRASATQQFNGRLAGYAVSLAQAIGADLTSLESWLQGLY